MRNVQLLEEQVANDMCEEVISAEPHENYERIRGLRNRVNNISSIVEVVNERTQDNLKRIDDLHHKLCGTQRRLDSIEDQLRALQRFMTDMCGIAAIFMVLICILVGYLLWRTAWL